MIRALLLVAALAPSLNAQAGRPEDSWTFSFLFENDLFGDTDQNYTNGVQLNWISPDLSHYRDSGRLPAWSLPLVRRLPFINEAGLQRNIALTVGQKIFTPEEIQRTDLIEDDRPYAGWLYLGVAFHNKNIRRLDTLELQLGVIGPAALAEDAQNFVHKLRGIDKARGWDNQLENEPGIAFIYERKWRMLQSRRPSGYGYDVIAHSGGTLGNVFTYLNGGFEARVGWNLPADFGTSVIRPGGDTNAPVDSNDPRIDRSAGLGVHFFTAVTGRAMLRDIFLDGNSFTDSADVDKHLLVGDLIVGVSLVYRSVKLSYAQVFRSKEFEDQEDGHNFGSVTFSYTF